MKLSNSWFMAGLVATGLWGCQKQDPATSEKLDKLLAKVDSIEKKLDSSGARRPNPSEGPQRMRPDPAAVYSVPIDGSPVKGPATAKVTLVKVGEFA